MRAAAEPLLACDDAAVLVVQMWAFAHAPDEWISVDNYRRGMRAAAALLDEYAAAHTAASPAA
jgi:acetylornithine deacetylase/succinyl-diaminopimelate desuccinylase-like protein